MGINQTIGPRFDAGIIAFTPTTPDTSTNVQTALENRALLSGQLTVDFAAANFTVANKTIFSVGTVAAGETIIIPDNYTVVVITNDSATAANAVTLPSGTNGQLLFIYNEDPAPTSGDVIIPAGYLAQFIYFNGWKTIKGIVG